MLEVSELDAFYGTSQALFGMALKINAGEVVTLLGRNGMGKTTTINSIMGILKPRKGSFPDRRCTITSHREAWSWPSP